MRRRFPCLRRRSNGGRLGFPLAGLRAAEAEDGQAAANVVIKDPIDLSGTLSVEAKNAVLEINPKSKIDNLDQPNKNKSFPAKSAGLRKERKGMDNLKEMLSQNPALKDQFDSAISDAEKRGAEKAKDDYAKRAEAAGPFLNHENDTVRGMAAKVVAGETSVDMLRLAAANYDQIQEQFKAEAAKKETDDAGATPAQTKTDGDQGAKMIDTINTLRTFNGSATISAEGEV